MEDLRFDFPCQPKSFRLGYMTTHPPTSSRIGAVALLAGILGILLSAETPAARETECGGEIPCACGDRVVEDYTMTADLGPCTRSLEEPLEEFIGLRVNSDVTLDCAGHAILGPADRAKEAFGIKVGSSTRAGENATIRNCTVRGFWWGIYVVNSSDILLENNIAEDNGWFDPNTNGTGYGIDIANSLRVTMRDNLVQRNGNEGLHLSASTSTVIENNTFVDNGFEQVYIISADNNEIRGNHSTGGRQGLEMRDSDNNLFSNNFWGEAGKHWLENDNDNNVFDYDHFEGTVRISDHSSNNVFRNCSFLKPDGDCVWNQAADNTLVRPYFAACKRDVFATEPIRIEQSATANRTLRKKEVTKVAPGCTADLNEDAVVDAADIALFQAALGSTPADAAWNSAADFDHDQIIGSIDAGVVDAQVGPCDALQNPAPNVALKKEVLAKGPLSHTVRFNAIKSADNENALVHVDFYVIDRIRNEMILQVRRPAGWQATFTHEFPRGKYMIYATAFDRYGANAQPKKRGLVVR